VNYFIESGTPQQSGISVRGVPLFDLGRNSLGRTPSLSQTDVLFYHDFTLGAARRLNLGVQVLNLFDQDTDTRIFTTRYRDGIPVSDAQFFAGFNAQAIAAATPRFGLTRLTAGPVPQSTIVRVQAKFFF
jgi:hypothetical protein